MNKIETNKLAGSINTERDKSTIQVASDELSDSLRMLDKTIWALKKRLSPVISHGDSIYESPPYEGAIVCDGRSPLTNFLMDKRGEAYAMNDLLVGILRDLEV